MITSKRPSSASFTKSPWTTFILSSSATPATQHAKGLGVKLEIRGVEQSLGRCQAECRNLAGTDHVRHVAADRPPINSTPAAKRRPRLSLGRKNPDAAGLATLSEASAHRCGRELR